MHGFGMGLGQVGLRCWGTPAAVVVGGGRVRGGCGVGSPMSPSTSQQGGPGAPSGVVVQTRSRRRGASLTPCAATEGVRERMDRLRSSKECALVPFLVAGDPGLDATRAALLAIDGGGADVIELGVPYSDPLADGPVIQEAATRALAAGCTLDKVLAMCAETVPGMDAPVVLFTYYNPIMARGVDTFMAQVAASGVKGLVVPDIPLEESELIRVASAKAGLELVMLVTPTTPVERMAAIAEVSEGFVYLVSVAGVTGARSEVSAKVPELLKQLKSQTDKPVAVGFGVARPDQAQQLRSWGADGVIVGSAVVRKMEEARDLHGDDVAGVAKHVGDYIKSMKEALA